MTIVISRHAFRMDNVAVIMAPVVAAAEEAVEDQAGAVGRGQRPNALLVDDLTSWSAKERPPRARVLTAGGVWLGRTRAFS